MKRIILDTSVYGRLIEDEKIINSVINKIPNVFVIYGSEIIRKEIRDTPKYIRHLGRNLRIMLLNLYTILIREHELKHNKIIETLSSEYFKEYAKQGGSFSNKVMKNDFTIIATATIHKLDIVVSDDERSMLSKPAILAFKIMNKKYGLENPEFVTYRKFKSKLTKYKNQEDLPV